MSEGGRQRIDKWLWFARIVKTRTAAQKLAQSGHVRINREKADASSRPVQVGDVITIGLERGVRVLRVAGFADRRGPFSSARLLYEDLTPPAADTPGAPTASAGPRPTKRDRRAVDALRRGAAPGDDDG